MRGSRRRCDETRCDRRAHVYEARAPRPRFRPAIGRARSPLARGRGPDHGSSQRVWSELPGHDRDPRLVALAERWLVAVDPNHRSWQYVWNELPGHPSEPGLIALAERWLISVDAEHHSWPYVWLRLPATSRAPTSQDARHHGSARTDHATARHTESRRCLTGSISKRSRLSDEALPHQYRDGLGPI